jgi:hypothetical protein
MAYDAKEYRSKIGMEGFSDTFFIGTLPVCNLVKYLPYVVDPI